MIVKNIRFVTINRSCHIPQDWIYDNWNCYHCANDNEYYQPFNDTDFIYLQSWFGDVVSADPLHPDCGWYDNINPGYIRARLFDYNGGLISQDVSELVERSMVGSIDNLSYQNIQINPNILNGIDCFYVEFEVVTSKAIGSVPASYEYFRTEPYRRVICEPTFLIEGLFKGFDSECKYYDLASTGSWYNGGNIYNSNFAHRDRYRVIGGYENDAFANTCAMNNDGTQQQIKTSTLKRNVYRLWTTGLPPYVANKLGNSITGYEFWIDDCIGCLCLAELNKNNDKGEMWWIDTHIEQIASEVKHFNCE